MSQFTSRFALKFQSYCQNSTFFAQRKLLIYCTRSQFDMSQIASDQTNNQSYSQNVKFSWKMPGGKIWKDSKLLNELAFRS